MGALEVKPKSTDSFTLFYKLVRMVQQKQVDRSSAVSFSTDRLFDVVVIVWLVTVTDK